MKRLTITFTDELSELIESMAAEIGIPQSAVVSLAVKEYFDQKEMIKRMPQIIRVAEEIAKREEDKEAKK
jgi:metal-responsive CopG/Arc/MetJ family transcriptional regulator